MALKTWLWNLGTAGVVVTAAGCDPTIAGETDSGVAGETEPGTDTEGETTPLPDTDTTPPQPSTGYYGTSYYGTSYYGTDTYYGTSYGSPECREDEDCELGECIDAGEPWSYCEALPIPGACDDEVEVALTWVREGEGAGTSAGLADDERVVLLDAVIDDAPVPVSVAPLEEAAAAVALPVSLANADNVVGAAAVDVDGDGDDDVLLSVEDAARVRVVAMLQEADGSYSEGESVEFGERGGAAWVRQFADGSFSLVTRLESGLLHQAVGLGDGTFSAPALSDWATEPLSDAVVGQLDASADDDIAVAVADGAQSQVEVLIDGGQLPVGAPGRSARSLHMDARGSWLITLDEPGTGVLELGRFQLGVGVEADTIFTPEPDVARLDSTVSDIDGDGRSDVVSLHTDGHLSVVFAASTGGACTQVVETGAVFETIARPGAGEEQGVVLSGADGVLMVRGVTPKQ
ncbi:MAG: hypothetical protein ACRBN8_30295 [Nannocystales bacterium]